MNQANLRERKTAPPIKEPTEQILVRLQKLIANSVLPERVMLTSVEVAALRGCAEMTIRSELCRGTLPIPAIRFGRQVRFRLSDVLKYLDDAGASSAKQ